MNPARIAILALAGLGASALAAPVPKEAKKTLLEQLQGKWLIVSYDTGGGPKTPKGDFATYTLAIDGEKISTATSMASVYPPVQAKFDFKSHPMKMDMPFGGDKVIAGIIKIDGDRLDWCYNPDCTARPTDFQAGDSHQHYIWKRIAE